MNTLERKLPIGIQTFEKMRAEGCLYVDKTAIIYQIAATKVPYFLSRPRRFGKSLLISTFEAYFQGRKDLFEGLAIEKLETKWEQYPVLHLDLNAKKYETAADLVAMLNQYLEKWEAVYGDEKKDRSPEERFSYIIEQAYLKTGKGVVVLVDEYDKPLLQALLDENLLDEYRRILKAFYGVLKSSDRYLRFIFLTGVTKFAQVSVFSDLNQLNDISMKPQYATICGITRQELEDTFIPELNRLAETNELTYEETLNKMTALYDGYHFCEFAEGVFNPFSVLNVFDGYKFSNYWFQTGTPTFLVELLKKSEYDLRTLIDGVEANASSFMEYRVDANNPIPLIYQSGYLTIKGYEPLFRTYTLGYPNEEVKIGFIETLIPSYLNQPTRESNFYVVSFVRDLMKGDIEQCLLRTRSFFSSIPYDLENNQEKHYQTIFYLLFRLMGQYVDVEVKNAIGRADVVIKMPDAIYVFEFKVDGTPEEALAQINSKQYAIPYEVEHRKVVKVGVNFDSTTRTLGQWKIEYS